MTKTVGAVLRRWFLAGLLVWIPLAVTLLVVGSVVSLLDNSLVLVPSRLRVPGLGVLLSILIVLGTGALTANLFGRQLLAWTESLFQRIPLVRSIYGGMKKLAETLFSGKGNSFRRVVLVEYPRQGIWSIGFLSGEPMAEARRHTGRDLLTVFIPTTPNPTSGFIVLVPREEVRELRMSVEDAMRFVISLGVVGPGEQDPGPPSDTMRG